MVPLRRARQRLERLAVGAAVLLCGTVLIGAPQSERKTGTPWTVGRTADGQPDLEGMWTNYDQTPFEQLPPEPRGPAVSTQDWLIQDSPTSPRRPSMVVDPPDGRVPLKPEAIAQ